MEIVFDTKLCDVYTTEDVLTKETLGSSFSTFDSSQKLLKVKVGNNVRAFPLLDTYSGSAAPAVSKIKVCKNGVTYSVYSAFTTLAINYYYTAASRELTLNSITLSNTLSQSCTVKIVYYGVLTSVGTVIETIPAHASTISPGTTIQLSGAPARCTVIVTVNDIAVSRSITKPGGGTETRYASWYIKSTETLS